MENRESPLDGQRIGVFGKGGCGKSTITVLLAKALRERGYGVCVVDADSTNLGLHRALGLKRAPEPLLEHFGGMIFSGGQVTCPVDDPTLLPGAQVSLMDLPRCYVGTTQEGILVVVAGKLGDLGPGAGCDGPIVKIARDLRLVDYRNDLVTLLDFKAGFEDPARGAIAGLDSAIVVVDPSFAAVQMAADLRQLAVAIQNGGLPATAHLEKPELVDMAHRVYREATIQRVHAVLNRVSGREMETQLRAALEPHEIVPLGTVREDPAVALAWLRGEAIGTPRAMTDARRVLEALEWETVSRTDDRPRAAVPESLVG